MNDAIKSMLEKYELSSTQDYINALKEIIQEIALLGLWRAKFYEHAAFYGGTALRVLYGLDRFSEDLDFSLLKTNKEFPIHKYNEAIKNELNAFGFDVEIQEKIKSIQTNIQSAFIKAETKKQLIEIATPKQLRDQIHSGNKIKIKMEIDTNPPEGFETEAKYLLLPIPFSVNTYQQPDLFAGKLHAVICRQWKNRIKGRDWYDFVWYVSRGIPFRKNHLQERLIQTGKWMKEKDLSLFEVKQLLLEKVEHLDIENAKNDVFPFIKDQEKLSVWSRSFFQEVISRLTSV